VFDHHTILSVQLLYDTLQIIVLSYLSVICLGFEVYGMFPETFIKESLRNFQTVSNKLIFVNLQCNLRN